MKGKLPGVIVHRLLLAALTIGAVACSKDAALSVTVKVAPGVKARCVRVYAQAQGGQELMSEAMSRDEDLIVAVYRGGELDGEITLGARGYLGEECKGHENALVLNEEGPPEKATFPSSGFRAVALKLDGVPAQFDQDGDGFRAVAHNGSDCLDTDAAVHPEATEICDDQLDNDCRNGADCANPFCENQLCDDGDACTARERCSQGSCGQAQPVVCNDPPSAECFSAAGTCSSDSGKCVYEVNLGAPCNGGHCNSAGNCVDSSIEVNCADGLDNDNNGLTDCDDPDCAEQACDDRQACTVGEVCGNGTCGGGQQKVCNSPPGLCWEVAGVCQPKDGVCAYTPKAVGDTCDVGRNCAKNLDCVPQETDCANRMDDDGDGLTDCEEPGCHGAKCDDENACTVDETCSPVTSRCEGGKALMCLPAPECMTSMCNPASGCSNVPTPGAPCSIGFCSKAGRCEAPFPYAPSNFKPREYDPSKRGGPYDLDCTANLTVHPTFDSTPGVANPFINWCPNAPRPPAPQVVTFPDGTEAVVLPMNALRIRSQSALRLTGSRPVILAVYGDVLIEGSLYGGASGVVNGPGGNPTACAAGVGGPGANGGNAGGGGGGGGGGFGSAGGAGGAGLANTAGGNAGTVNGTDTLVPLRGGCGGSAGGNQGGTGGGAGGAIQISASGTLEIAGRVGSPGGGGRGATSTDGGGGGGGSGGAILLEGNTVRLRQTAIILANGGGGGEGRGPSAITLGTGNGADGQDGAFLSPFTATRRSGGQRSRRERWRRRLRRCVPGSARAERQGRHRRR